MPRIYLLLLLAVSAALAVAAPPDVNPVSSMPVSEEFRWRGWVSAGSLVEINGVQGNIYAERSAGDEVEVVALKRGGSDAETDEVKIEVVEHDNGVTVCAVYPSDDPSKPFECRPTNGGGFRVASRTADGHTKLAYQNGGGGQVRVGDVRVDFVVRVPARLRFVGRTVEGDIELHSLDRDIEAHSVLGNVAVELPAKANAEMSLRTLSGKVLSEFSLHSQKDQCGTLVKGTVGRAKRQLAVRTSQGSISVTKSQTL
ncbi:MAG: DUF4097 family beta strand repeat-containing protein [Bryobacteraceae bacterium]